MPEQNKDLDVPRSSDFWSPVLLSFPLEKRPIYWGPNQLLTGFSSYNEPSGWRNYEALNIPKVVRFINGAPEEYDDQDYNDEDTEAIPCSTAFVVSYETGGSPSVYRVVWFCDSVLTYCFYAFVPEDGDEATALFNQMLIDYPMGYTVNNSPSICDEPPAPP
jgi:hypothetical protein